MIAVLGNGPDICCPKEHAALMDGDALFRTEPLSPSVHRVQKNKRVEESVALRYNNCTERSGPGVSDMVIDDGLFSGALFYWSSTGGHSIYRIG